MSPLYPPSARPAEICGALLAALEAAEGRRRNRKRDQTGQPFEEWLLQCALACAPESAGAVSAMARAIFEEWRLAHSLHEFKNWLDEGAPSADADEGKRKHHNADQGERQ